MKATEKTEKTAKQKMFEKLADEAEKRYLRTTYLSSPTYKTAIKRATR